MQPKGHKKNIQIHKMYESGEVQDLQQSLEGLIEVQIQMVHFPQPEIEWSRRWIKMI